jgi:hypothetical protein
MADTTTPTADRKPREAKPVVAIKINEPVAVAIDQAATRNYTEVFNGWDAQEKALAYAKDRTVSVKRPVIVVGPDGQHVVTPPEPVTVGTAAKVNLTPPAEAEPADVGRSED